MPGQLPDDTRKERMARLLTLGDSLSQRFRARFAGTARPVLWESERLVAGASTWFGHTDNYVAVYTAGRFLHNRVTSTFLSGLYHDGMWGHVPGGSR
jgi:tRNA A37 methylthiotransferase MiaB